MFLTNTFLYHNIYLSEIYNNITNVFFPTPTRQLQLHYNILFTFTLCKGSEYFCWKPI